MISIFFHYFSKVYYSLIFFICFFFINNRGFSGLAEKLLFRPSPLQSSAISKSAFAIPSHPTCSCTPINVTIDAIQEGLMNCLVSSLEQLQQLFHHIRRYRSIPRSSTPKMINARDYNIGVPAEDLSRYGRGGYHPIRLKDILDDSRY